MLLLFSIIVLCFLSVGIYMVYAQDETTADADWKQELSSDKQEIKAQKQEISQNAQEARAEETQLRQQIKAAMDSGDMETAQQLKEQLKSMHQENLQERKQDREEMQAAKQDFKSDAKEARQEGYLPDAGLEKRPRFDADNNPPGPKGGAGTNWENKPGPKGGPGAGPGKKVKK